ncbi:Nesprin-4, partial [Galemys pyrenaicus]
TSGLKPPAMAQSLPWDPRPETLNHPPGAPRELDIAACTICLASGEERIRPEQTPEQAQKLGPDFLDPLEHFQVRLRGTETAAGPPRLPTPSSHEDPAGGKHREHPTSSREVLEPEQDSLHLCLLRLGLRLQELEQGLGPWASAQSGMAQLQVGRGKLRYALLVFGEGLAQRTDPQARASLERVLRALGAHRDRIFWRLWRLQAQLVSYSLVFEEANTLDQDLEADGDSDGPGPAGAWGPLPHYSHPTLAELEWDPAGDVGGLRPSGRKTAWTAGAPCELCGHRGPQGRAQGLEDTHASGLSRRKHLAGQHALVQKTQAKKRQASPNLQDVMLEVDPGAAIPASRQSLTFVLLLLLFLLVGATLLLPTSGGLCCSPTQLARTPHLVLSYVNGPPPI